MPSPSNKIYYQDTGGPVEVFEQTHSKTGTRYFIWVTSDTDEDEDGVYDSYKQYISSPEEPQTPVLMKSPPVEIVSSTPIPKTVEESLPAQLLSTESGFAPFETLFHDLQLQADATYNFWEPKEETTAPDRGIQILEDVPRYIHLRWNQAPSIIKDASYVKQKMSLLPNLPDSRTADIELSDQPAFGLGGVSSVGMNLMGVNWSPALLKTENFNQIVESMADGYMSPGVIEAVATVPTQTVTSPPMPSSNLIDEDEYLAHSDQFEGISYPEMNAAAWRTKSVMFATQQKRIIPSTLSPSAASNLAVYMKNQIAVSTMNNGSIEVKAVNGQGPAISLVASTLVSSVPTNESRVEQIMNRAGMEGFDHPLEKKIDDRNVKVKLIHTNIQGVFSDSRIKTISKPEQAESTIALAPFAGNLAVYSASGYKDQRREPVIPSFPFPKLPFFDR